MIGYAVTSSITITAGAQSRYASRRSARARSVKPLVGATASSRGAGAATLIAAHLRSWSSSVQPSVGDTLEVRAEGVHGLLGVAQPGGRVQRLLDRERDVGVGGRDRARRRVLQA